MRKIELIDGEHEVNEVFFDNVRVPVEQRIGEEPRAGRAPSSCSATSAPAPLARRFGQVSRAARVARQAPGDDGRPLIENTRFRDRLAQVQLELMALEVTVLKVMSTRRGAPGPEASVLKLKGSEIRQTLTELHMLALGPYAAPHLAELLAPEHTLEPLHELLAGAGAAATGQYLNFRKATIYGGSNEVQRNIIAKQLLGL